MKENELVKPHQVGKAELNKNFQLGTLMEIYKDHIVAAYEISKELKILGYERPWVTVTEKTEVGGPQEVTKFNLDVKQKIRLEIR